MPKGDPPVIRIVSAFMICLLALSMCNAQPPEPLIPNLDLSRGTEGWHAWTGSTAHAWALDTTIGHDGKPSLRIEARNRGHEVMVMADTTRLQPGERYGVEVWWRTEQLSADAQVDLRMLYRDAAGKWLAGTDLHPYATRADGEWVLQRYRTTAPERTASASLGFWIREATGTIWVSGITIQPLPRGQRNFDSMLLYDPDQVELGAVPERGFRKLQAAGSPLLARAARWNRMLVELAFAQEELARAHRAWVYAGRPAEGFAEHERPLAELAAHLDRLQQTYGRLFVAGGEGELASDFDVAAGALEPAIHAARRKAGGLMGTVALPFSADDRGLDVRRPEVAGPWWDPVRPGPRSLLWTRWSSPEHRELEEPLDLGEGQTLTNGHPAAMKAGVCDWSNYDAEAERLREAGARHLSLITHYGLHDKGYLGPEFVAAHPDPDIYMWDAAGKPIGPPSGLCNPNWLNPAVRAHMVDVLTQMARYFRDHSEYRFYVTAWESAGPYCGGLRIGGNPSHQTAFREYLRARYGSVAALNARWQTQYASFEAIAPLPETPAAVGEPGSPLAIESQRWAQETYLDMIRLIRDTLHAVDPTKPVVGEQSGLLTRIISPRVFDSVDILGYHNRARTTMPVQVWMSSLQRYTRKPTALFENFWGCQEDHPRRMGEEQVMRAQLRRYLYRHAVWGRCLQTWWYSYTSAPYLTTYNCNWLNPVYDLTTLRYSAAGLPVEKAKVDALEELLLGSEIVPSRLLVVQPYATMLAQGPNSATWREWLGWHDLLFPRNLLYEALPDTWFADGTAKLSDFDLVVLPLATHLDRRFSRQLVEFLRAGGTCVAAGPCGLFDELGLADGALLAAALPGQTVTRASGPQEEWRYSYGAAAGAGGWVAAAVGKGRLLLLPASVNSLPEHGAALLSRIREIVTPAAEALATPGASDEQPRFELLLRRLPDGRHLLCALNADPDRASTGDIAVNGVFEHIADVDGSPPRLVRGRVEGGRTRFTTLLEAGGTAYYLLAP